MSHRQYTEKIRLISSANLHDISTALEVEHEHMMLDGTGYQNRVAQRPERRLHN